MSAFLKIKEVAEILRVSSGYVYRLIRENSLPGIQFRGTVRISRDDLQAWIDRHRTQRQSDVGDTVQAA